MVTISGLSGTMLDAQSVVVSGSGFGTGATTQFLGGSGGTIDAGTAGASFSLANWITCTNVGNEKIPTYSTTQKRARSKSIYCYYQNPSGTDSASWLGYVGNADITAIYFTYWVYYEHQAPVAGDAAFQWKSWRVNADATTATAMGGAGVSSSLWWNGSAYPAVPPTYYNYNTRWHNATVDSDEWRIGADYSYSAIPRETWVRMEVYLNKGTIDTADGTIQVYHHLQSAAVTEIINASNKAMWNTGDSAWKGLYYTTAIANLAVTGDIAKIYLDDLYWGTSRARVEIGDNSTWTSCKHREIQPSTAWASGEITFTLNQGTFKNGDSAYLFVIDSSGNISNGYGFTFPGGNRVFPYSSAKFYGGRKMRFY